MIVNLWRWVYFAASDIIRGMKTQIIAAFPGTGKSYLVGNIGKNSTAIDLDTNKYTNGYDKNGKVINAEFPDNYLEAVKQAIGKTDYLFVGCQPEVLDILKKEGMNIILVYPERQLKDEYINRFNARNSSREFSNLIHDNWDQFIDYLEAQNSERLILKSGQYISDVIDR